MLFNFKQWVEINEDLDPTQHFKERVSDRIENMKDVLLPNQLLSKLPNTIQASRLKKEAKEVISNEVLKRISRLEKSNLGFDRNSGYPLISPVFSYDGVDYPVVIVSEVTDGKTGQKKESRGNQIYVPIRDGKLMTIIPYPSNMDELEIEKRQRDHSERKFGISDVPFRMIPRGNDYQYKITLDNGSVAPMKSGTHVPIDYSKDQQYNLAKGNKIKVFVKFAGGFVEGEIDRINNRMDDGFRDDGVGVDLLIDVKGKKMKLPKKLPVGEVVELPIGQDGEWIKAQVSSPGYIIDSRMDEPINLKFKAKK